MTATATKPTIAPQALTLSIGQGQATRYGVAFDWQDDKFTLSQNGESHTASLADLFRHEAVMHYLLQYAVKQALGDANKTLNDMTACCKAWQAGYTSQAMQAKAEKAAKAAQAKAAESANLTQAEIIACFESLDPALFPKGEAIASALNAQNSKVMFESVLSKVKAAYPDYAEQLEKAAKAKVEAVKMEAAKAAESVLAEFGLAI